MKGTIKAQEDCIALLKCIIKQLDEKTYSELISCTDHANDSRD